MATVRVDGTQILQALQGAETRALVALRMEAKEGATIFENYAKINRPWRDRTGRARQSLKGYVEESPGKIRICIAHGVTYGESLEYGHEKRYAILHPTVLQCGQRVLALYRNLMQRVFG